MYNDSSDASNFNSLTKKDLCDVKCGENSMRKNLNMKPFYATINKIDGLVGLLTFHREI